MDAISIVKDAEEKAKALVKEANDQAKKDIADAKERLKKDLDDSFKKFEDEGKAHVDQMRKSAEEEAAPILAKGKTLAEKISNMDGKKVENAVNLIVERMVK